MKEYRLNFLRKKKIGEKYLVTTDHGSWIYLGTEELDKLISKDLDESLYARCEEKGIIITEDNKSDIIKNIREKYAFLSSGTSLHIIVATLRCNLHCVYCHASSCPQSFEGYDMDEKTAKKTVDFIFQSPAKNITIEIQGGEPLLNYDVIEYIVKYSKKLNEVHKKNLRLTVVTNFGMMDGEKLDFFENEDVDICTSLDGPKELHEKNRNFGSHGPVVKWLEEIRKREKNGILHKNAVLTVTHESLKYPREIVDEYVKNGVKDIHLRFLNNLGNAKQDWEKICYSSEEFIDYWKKSLEYIFELDKSGIFLRERGATIIMKKILGGEPNYLELRSPCGAAIGQLLYNYDGAIYTCDEARMVGEDIFKLGNVKENNYSEIISSNQTCGIVAASINDTQICDSCVYKPYCGICPVCNYAEQGSIIAKIPQTMRCQIYKAQFDYLFDKVLNDSIAKEVLLTWVKN
ncbi:His-Xaa-Ser system radical SAM maturase HxsB [Candidatus Pacearchaeota archaeon]|nr:His-Xaa-Ser system radical SAM maturase HxsB [Candidatus Pacearchaeota archaeon]